VADDATCIYWNPAGMMQVSVFRTAISCMYSKLDHDRIYGFAGVYERSDETNTALGVSWTGYYSNGVEGRDESGNFTGLLGSAGNTFSGSVAAVLSDTLKAGLSIKVHLLRLADLQGNGFSFDAGVIFKPFGPLLKVGFVIKDVNTGIQWSSGRKEFIPFSVRAGAAYYFLPEKFVFTVEPEFIQNSAMKIHAGAEYLIDECISVRVGVNDLKLSSGFGVKILNYAVDYSFLMDNNRLGDEHRLSLSACY